MSDKQIWLDSLKVGDEVAVDIGRFGRSDYEIRKISRITPTRRFSLEGKSSEFDSNGRERGRTDRFTPRQQLEPVTQEIRDHLRKKYVVARMERVNWQYIDLPRLEKFLDVLDSND